MKIQVEVDYRIGDLAYLITDKDQEPRMVTQLLMDCNGTSYQLALGTHKSWHESIELCRERDVLKSITS